MPQSLLGLLDANVLRDQTADRDVAIRFEGVLADGSTLVLWIDHPSPLNRVTMGGRYQLELWEKGRSPVDVVDTDRVTDVMAAISAAIDDRGGPRLLR